MVGYINMLLCDYVKLPVNALCIFPERKATSSYVSHPLVIR